jgi:hypothetical protein
MAEAFGHWPLTMECQIQSQSSPVHERCVVDKVALVQVSHWVLGFSIVNIIP